MNWKDIKWKISNGVRYIICTIVRQPLQAATENVQELRELREMGVFECVQMKKKFLLCPLIFVSRSSHLLITRCVCVCTASKRWPYKPMGCGINDYYLTSFIWSESQRGGDSRQNNKWDTLYSLRFVLFCFVCWTWLDYFHFFCILRCSFWFPFRLARN